MYVLWQCLRSSEGGGEGASHKGAVQGARRAALGLHFCDAENLTEHVLTPACTPRVRQLAVARLRVSEPGSGDRVGGGGEARDEKTAVRP